jgi:hypothetical protein
MADITPLAEGKLYALSNPYALNGFVSTHAPHQTGFAPYQSYLAVEDDAAVLVDAGMSAHDDVLVAQVESIIGTELPLTLFPLRHSEFASVCNVRPLAERLRLERMYGLIDGVTTWADFRPELSPFGTVVGGGVLERVETAVCHSGDSVPVGDRGRVLSCLNPPIRLTPSHWLYDERAETLFTADSFTHVWRQTSAGPWIVGPNEEPPSAEAIYEFLVTTRYWWLPGADTAPMRRDIREVFERHRVTTIAPSFGCVLSGAEVVDRHVALLDEVLTMAAGADSIGLTVGREAMGRAA